MKEDTKKIQENEKMEKEEATEALQKSAQKNQKQM